MSEGLKSLVGRKMTKKVKFMGEDVVINKLSVSEVMEIQRMAKEVEQDESQGFSLLRNVIRMSVEGAEELSDADFDNFPLDELSTLSSHVMKFSGIDQSPGK
jgi:hypothetical protein